mgnify:CR=1 FL=1|jgi:hypothetical protein
MCPLPHAALLLLATISLSLASPTDVAKKFFDQYVALEAAFDPATADLYSDDAKIQNTRIYPDGRKRTLTMPAPAYKTLIKQVMPSAKLRGDTNKYSDIKITQEGDKFRVTATRFSNLKKYSSPLSLLIGRDKNDVWLIYEELSESQP